jgi:hypothetical protein
MNSFWVNIVERFGSRSAWLFMPVLLLFLAVVLLGGTIGDWIVSALPPGFLGDFNSDFNPVYALLGIAVLVAAWVLSMVRRARARRGNKFSTEQLSRDELSKARSKLRSQIKPVKPAAPRAPDINLKY